MEAPAAGVHNRLVRAARQLHLKKHRWEQRCFLVEGPTLISAALAAGLQIERVFFDAARGAEPVLEALAAAPAPAIAVGRRTIEALAQTKEPQGMVAVVRFFHKGVEELAGAAPPGRAAIILVLHDLNDPGNAGTLVRSAEAFGASAVCFGPHAVEPYNDKLVRAAMGSLFRVPIFRYERWEALPAATRRAGFSILAAEAGAPDVRSAEPPDRVALLIGHERRGISDIPAGDVDSRIGIPQLAAAGSLNAGVAGSIMLHELGRFAGLVGRAVRTNDW